MAHVFLSHSSADAAGTKAVARLLQNAGLEVWLDLDRITQGSPWLSALEDALKDSTHFVVLVGETGVQRWVDREVRSRRPCRLSGRQIAARLGFLVAR